MMMMAWQTCYIIMQYSNAYKKRGLLFKRAPPYTEMPNRTIITNVPDLQAADNSIKTSKYTPLTFLPLNLIVQFSKLPNVYFLVIGIMQMIPQISVSGGFPVIFIPLAFVVTVSAIKDFYEDLKRKASDLEINGAVAHRLQAGGFVDVPWEKLRIGDLVRVQQGEQFPADIILLQSADDNLTCFIQTKNLDGETNLKHKQVKYEIGKDLRSLVEPRLGELYGIRLQFNYERPNPFIYSFTGSLGEGRVPLDNNNIALRGCGLKATQWVVGVVIYSGVDSKIMLNSNKTRQKKSRLQFKMGLIVLGIFGAQMLLTLTAALVSTLTINAVVLQYGKLISMSKEMFVKWGSWVLLFTNFVPISLIVTLQMVKYIQGTRIANDQYITTQPAQVRVQTSSLNEELGQIQHLFTDKTGTLTRNYMSFKHMVVGEQTYGYDSQKQPLPQGITNVDFHDQQFFRSLSSSPPQFGTDIFDMLVSFGLCHSVIIEQDGRGGHTYNASSPDELAFINMAKCCGWEYLGLNSENEVCLKTPQGQLKYRLLHTIEFDSDRKRMSVILQRDGRVFVYCKGADNIMLSRVKPPGKKGRVVAERVQEWSQQGLRTLLFAKREIDKKDYQKWAKLYASSLSKLQKVEQSEKKKVKQQLERKIARMEMEENRVGRGSGIQGVTRMIIEDDSLPADLLTQSPQVILHRLLNDNSVLTERQKNFIEKHFDRLSEQATGTARQMEEMLQRQLQLIGATAIEDQLQDNVKPTIQAIRAAGVKVWMLTGDKKETAINIALSCGLLSTDMAVVDWKTTLQDVVEQRDQLPPSRQACLIATGESLLGTVDEQTLVRLVNRCKAVICCRVTPKQKQDMVWLMRKNKCTTLAIGDGANDVNMINTAHVGIGIKGVQGAQAALCSDYAISQFQIIRQLMLFHGRECYRKNSQLILFNFYKNVLLVMPQMWFGFNNHFSSATIYDPWVYQLYNVAFTAFPVIAYAIFDTRHSKQASLHDPTLYRQGLENKLFNLSAIGWQLASPVIYASLLSFITYFALGISLDSSGMMLDMMGCGMAIFAQCVIIANAKVLILAHQATPGLKILAMLGIFAFYASSLLEEAVFPLGQMGNTILVQMRSINYWSVVAACAGLVVMIEVVQSRWEVLVEQERECQVEFEEIELPLMGKQPMIQL